ncbi:hypothetical protein NLK61_24655 [Pseudomonas fuscovaginae UPB0736]|uniref:DUF6603 domain-containing protein n=1 Tax=Pseudomonas asplenii TaxID=53407 RepID=UPI000287DD1D|nr:DUF6603 domain-containing protein [Pseudomonas fuscovaginae]UUQ64370.1 hypothetical protein NLK61_24655 [Pseudomonas fuscovaginae UPB0736]
MDAKELLAELRKGFPEAQRSGVLNTAKLPGTPCSAVFKTLGLPEELTLHSKQGWVESDKAYVLRGYADNTLLGVKKPSVFLRVQPEDPGCQVLLGINLPVNWQFTAAFPNASYPILNTLACRSLLVASGSISAPLGWLQQVSEVRPADEVPAVDGKRLVAGPGASLFGWDSDASDLVGVDTLLTLLREPTLKVAISMGLVGSAPANPLDQSALLVADNLPAQYRNDSSLLRRNETWCGFNRASNSVSQAYLSLHAVGDKGWDICPGLINLSDVQLRFSTLRPQNRDSILSFALQGVFTLGGLPLLIKGHLPGKILSGGLDPAQPAPSLTTFVNKLFKYDLPGQMTIERLEFWAKTKESRYGAALSIEGDCRFDIDRERFLAFHRLEMSMQRDLQGVSGRLAGGFSINEDNEFDIDIDLASETKKITGGWTNHGSPPSLNDLLRALHLPPIGELPGGLQLHLSEAHFTFQDESGALSFALDFNAQLTTTQDPTGKRSSEALLVAGRRSKNDPWGYLYAMDLALKLDLSLDSIPLAGKLIPADSDRLGIERVRLIAASKVLPPIPADSTLAVLSEQSLDGGLSLAVDLKVGSEPSKTLMVRFGGQAKTPQVAGPAKPIMPATPIKPVQPAKPVAQAEPEPELPEDEEQPSADKVAWIKIQRALGPLRLQRIGFSMTDKGAVAVLLDAGLDTRGLSIMLSGLQANIPLLGGASAPTFDLAGLAVQYRSSELSIGGALSRFGTREQPTYSGQLAVSAGRFGATALGSYTEVYGRPSFTAFTFIDVPLGGPPCFFVTGLAAGVGFNRTLRLPEVDKVGQFPLIQAAMGTFTEQQAMDSLNKCMEPAADQDWFAAGVRFSSFKMIESFALLTLSFGARSEVALLGQSTLSLPPSTSKKRALTVVYAELLLKASLQLEEGLLAVNAQLSSTSWVFSRDARLTGGFAFYLWFGNSPYAGDFVVTLGGYHPQFKVPAHYPQVPRLGLNWRVSDKLTIKGELYFALTPSVIMAGGLLDATWQSSGVQAWFQVQTHFLIRFKPFSYRISATVSIGVSVKVDLWLSSYTLNARVNANLDLWGPDFGGLALVDLSVVSFTIDFGDQKRPSDTPIDWQEFRESFLPGPAELKPGQPLPTQSPLIGISAPSGLLGTVELRGKSWWKVDPANLRLVLSNPIPVTEVSGHLAPTQDDWNRNLGVAPMNKPQGSLTSTLSLSIQRTDNKDVGSWSSQALLGSVPAGLWGNGGATLQDPAMLANALIGLDLRPVPHVAQGSLSVLVSRLQVPTPLPLTVTCSNSKPDNAFYEPGNTLAQLGESLSGQQSSKKRNDILAALHRQHQATATRLDLSKTASAAPDLFRAAPYRCSLGAA